MKPLLLSLLAIAALAAAPEKHFFTGVITDSMCPIGDHSQMKMGPTDAECTIACVREHGATYVLYDGKKAYDLNNQPGLREAGTYQAWGSRGTDQAQAFNLGMFYEDNVAKKRWVVKFNDKKKLDQIDAVFVTVEPHGGSERPTGKPLLYAYLKVAPNHP